MNAAAWFRWNGDDLILRVRVQPRAARNALAGLHGDRMKIRLTAPPVDGKANAAIITFVAELCDVAPSQVTLTAGAGAREKSLRVHAPRRLPPGVIAPTK